VRHYVVVGSGVAGLSAAEVLRERDPGATISLIYEEPHSFYSRPGLAYLLAGLVPEEQLFARTQAELRDLRLNWIHARAAQLLPEAHQVVLSNGQGLTYDRLLIATGSTAVPPDFPGGDLAGVVKFDNLDDARRILKLARRGRTAVVIGGGITALELVEGLRARGVRTHYFLRGDRYWANVLDEVESHIVEERLKAEGVVIHYRTEIKAALGRKTLAGVETTTGEKLPCHILGVAIGVRPRCELAQPAGLKLDRGILVDEFLRTSAPDVFAAGDVAQVRDPRSGRAILDTLWSTALAQGRAAGANMAGAQVPYVKQVALNVTQLAGLMTTIIGAVGSGGRDQDQVTISRGNSEAWSLLPQAQVIVEKHDVNRIRLLVGERTLVGAVVMGDQTLSRPLHRLIAEQADITPIRAALRADPASALSLISDFYQNWERNHVTPAH
jgi:NADPH-dependent 2,4-dienoyl-CoA reductase/sulfur reductase-like enzyme